MKKNNHWKTYITDYKHITGDLNYLRIEATYKPSHQDILQVTRKYGFSGSPESIEYGFNKGSHVVTWGVAE